MAKKPTKKDEAEAKPGEGADQAKAKKKKMIILGGAGLAVVLLGGGAAAYFTGMIGGGSKSSVPAAQSAAQAVKSATFLDLPEMTVNLSSPDQRAVYLKIKISLEVSDAEVVPKIQPILPRVLDAFQVYLRELRTSDLDGSAGLFRVKEELQKRINIAIHPFRVDAVLFREILIQ